MTSQLFQTQNMHLYKVWNKPQPLRILHKDTHT